MSHRKGMEPEKRKTAPNDAVGGSQKKTREENTAVSEEEVDEFFAILRRIHVAVDYFKNGDGHIRNSTERGSLAFASESIDTIDNKGVQVAGDAKENLGFDLNADPETDRDPL